MKRITPKRDKIADLLEDIKASNTFLTVENGKLRYIMRSTDDLKDFGYLDDSRRRAQLTTNVSYQNIEELQLEIKKNVKDIQIASPVWSGQSD